MKKNLLIIVSRLLQGGIDTVLLEYLTYFNRKKYQITLAIGIHMEELEKYAHTIPDDIHVEYLVKSHSLIKYRKKKIIERLPATYKFYDELILGPIRRRILQKKLNALYSTHDIVIDFDSTFYSFLKKCPIPKIAFFHFSFQRYHNGKCRKLNRLGKKMQVYDKIVTVCNEMKKEGEELFPYLKGRFITIYNSFNFETIRRKSCDPIPEQPPYIIASERLEETQKDVTTLLKAYKLLIDTYDIQEKLYIIGEGKSRENLEELQKELCLENKVRFLGFIQNPYPWVKGSRAFVLSSKFEGFGNVLVEAMILDVPIVSTDCPTGPKEILSYGEAGLLTPVGDEKQMAKKLHRILTDSELRKKIREQYVSQVEKFNVKRNILEIEDLIADTLHRG